MEIPDWEMELLPFERHAQPLLRPVSRPQQGLRMVVT
jgi:hypothetical protein